MSGVLHHPWALWMIFLPLAAAVAAFLLPRRAGMIGMGTALAMPLLAALAAFHLYAVGPLQLTAGDWPLPLGIALRLDGLAAMMLVTCAVVGLVVSVYAQGYFPSRSPGRNRTAHFWPLWLFLWGAASALFLSADLFNLYVTLEMVTLASVALAALEGRPAALSAAMRYLLVGMAGSLFYLLGVALLYAAYGTVDLSLLGEAMTANAQSRAAMALMVGGLLFKSALFPMHFWLPPAHSQAPAPVSALLSALVVKTSYVIILRLWFEVFPGVASPLAGHLLGVLGATAILWGSLMALRQERLKLLVAYSTVAQIGYLFLVFPLASSGTAASVWAGAIFFILAHACGKAAMFLVAGAIHHTVGHDRINHLAGAGGPLGVLVVIFALASVTIIGLPPSGGFFAKWLLLDAAIVTGQWGYVVVMAFGTLLAAAYVVRVLAWAFLDVERTHHATLPWVMKWPPLALSVVSLLLGLGAYVPVLLSLLQAPVAGAVLIGAGP
ncbi:complex I subunit 5 family protein [Geoalkalibacter subterraneus]|uniref:Oxidoreductase n=1 Tax=Geoalkalibacter subterraneus TaxID=483547 RepID=A0A0B5FBM7_9BACT|nr:proton-conducting transporter membrane subunit [Geoalkalibacter subterraneus]AJF05552.1 hypothetical protein GSUB_01765 [Geoalkalibacter subterraneus]